LDSVGIQLDSRGRIPVNDHFATSGPGIYAIGDVIRGPMLAHKAEDEGVVAAEVIAGKPARMHYKSIPSVVYTWPEIAVVGLSERQVKESGREYRVGKFPFSANGRARTSGETEGFVKIIRDAKYGEILGAHIVGAHATEMIHELVVARTNEYTVEEVDLAIHAHPTLSEAVAEASLDSLGKMIHA
jgi:dihydrolipoamide dehydrogenase